MPSLRVHDPRRGEAPSPLDGQVSPLALHSSALHWFRCHTPSRTNTHTSPRPVRISTLSLKSLLTHKRGSVDWFHPTTSGHIRAYLLRPQSHFLLVLSGGLPPLFFASACDQLGSRRDDMSPRPPLRTLPPSPHSLLVNPPNINSPPFCFSSFAASL